MRVVENKKCFDNCLFILLAGVGKGGVKGMVRGSASENNFHAGALDVGTSEGTIDTGAEVDRHGVEGKFLGNGATLRNDKLEGCVSGFCGSVNPSPAISMGKKLFGSF